MNRIKKTIAIAALLLLCGTFFTATAQTAKTRSTPSTVPAPQDYCTSTGGTLETRYPVYGTNNATQDWLQLQGREGFCQYTQVSDGSRIHVSLETLFTTESTLPAAAGWNSTPRMWFWKPASFLTTPPSIHGDCFTIPTALFAA